MARSEPERGGGAEPTLATLLGGRGGAVDATVPVVAFVAVFTLADVLVWAWPVAWAGGAAVLAGAAVGAVRLATGKPARSVVLGLLGVTVAALVALSTGRAVDFFLVQIVSNAASALVWAVSIVARWPLLGIIVGTLLGQRTRWRRDPDLMRGYQRASWVWVAQYAASAVVALGIARVLLTWPLVGLCVFLSWRLLRSALPPEHGGLRHPRDRADRPASST
jgi:hypothetical protein